MAAEVWDNRHLDHAAGVTCQACGMVVDLWVSFEGFGDGWSACPSCIRDAVAALDDHDLEKEDA